MQRLLFDRYLDILGIKRGKPTSDALFDLVGAHLQRIPFENLSKLYYKKHRGLRALPTLELFLDGVERLNLGGTCYTNNFYLCQLLIDLGYQTRLCGADMAKPDVHMVSMVTLDHREYLVDVGYAAPFLEPLPRDLTADFTIALGRDKYVLKPQDVRGYSCLEQYRDGNLKHCYWAKPYSRQVHEFEQVIADSYSKDATFMNAILLSRFYPNRSIVIHNLTLIESQGSAYSVEAISGREELAQIVYERFSIPEEFTLDAVSGLGKLEDAWD